MSLVLAIEPDSPQAEPLNSVVRAKLGAELQMVTSAYAAIVAMNQRIPDVVLLGRSVPQEQRTKIVTHLRSLQTDDGQVRTLDIPQFAGAAQPEKPGFQNPFRKKEEPGPSGADMEEFARKIGACLAAAEDARVRAMASMLGRPADSEWDAVALDESLAATKPEPAEPISDPASGPAVPITDATDVRSADLMLIEAEVEFRLKSELERLQSEAAKQQARELSRVEAEAAERRAREIARVEAETAQQRALELARIEKDAASQRESAVAEARAAADAAAREALAAELERVRREAEEQLAAEIRRVRDEADQKLATQLDLAQAQAERDREERLAHARAEAAAAARAAAIEEARQVVEEAAARAKDAEEEVARVRAEADAQLKAAVTRARADSEAQLQAQVARAQAEAEARLEAQLGLEAQLASVIGEAEQVRHAHRQATFDADQIRTEAAEAARAAAESALAAETERIRREADQRLEAEIARLRIEAAGAEAQRIEDARLAASFGEPAHASAFAQASRLPLHVVRWDIVATAAVILVVVVAGVMYLPRAVSSAARTSSALVGTAGNAAKQAAKQAVAAAPGVTRRAINAAERALPRPDAPKAAVLPDENEVNAAAEAAADTGPGFITAFSRIPMDVYADGRRIGTTEDGQLLLKSGPHRIEFVSERFRYRFTTSVTIRPGHVLPYTVTLPSAAVHVTTTPGAEIWLEGERIGVAPLPPFQVPIGTRDIAAKDASGSERRKSIEVKYGETVEVSLAPAAVAGDASPSTPHLAPLTRN